MSTSISPKRTNSRTQRTINELIVRTYKPDGEKTSSINRRDNITPKLRRLDAVRQEQEVRPLRDRKQLEGTARQQWTSPSRCAASNSHSTEDTAPTRISTSTSWSRCSDWRSGPKTRTRRGTSCGRHYSRHNRIRRWVWECFHTK